MFASYYHSKSVSILAPNVRVVHCSYFYSFCSDSTSECMLTKFILGYTNYEKNHSQYTLLVLFLTNQGKERKFCI